MILKHFSINNNLTPSSSGLWYIRQKERIPDIPEHCFNKYCTTLCTLDHLPMCVRVLFDRRARFDLCVLSSSFKFGL